MVGGNGFLVGRDAIDLAKVSELQLNRSPCSATSKPDTGWEAAEDAIKAGQAEENDYYIDLDRLCNEDAGQAILSLVGLLKAWLDYCTTSEHVAS